MLSLGMRTDKGFEGVSDEVGVGEKRKKNWIFECQKFSSSSSLPCRLPCWVQSWLSTVIISKGYVDPIGAHALESIRRSPMLAGSKIVTLSIGPDQ